MSHKLSIQELDSFRKDFDSNERNHVAARAAQHSGVAAASYNSKVSKNLSNVFSIELDTDNVTNQLKSGRCWEFSALNFMRHAFGKKYKAKDFTLSQAYNFFWDKIERANIFYDMIIKTADKPLDDREVRSYLDSAGQDGGEWDMATSLIDKYGVVPTYAMPESFNTDTTANFSDALGCKMKKDALVIRQLVKDGKTDELEDTRKKFLNEVYRMTAIAVGEPPKTFDLEYRDDDKKYHLDRNLTPHEFYTKYFSDIDLSDYVVLVNAPDHEYNKLYSLPFENNVEGKFPVQLLNVPMEYLAQSAIAQLKDGEAVWFGNDVLKQKDDKTGYLDADLYKVDDLLDVDTSMSKADRLATGQGSTTHAMTLVGVDLDDGDVRQWKVENSWGEKVGKKGYYVMSPSWFNDYVYQVVVHKKYLTAEQRKLAEGPATPVKPWDSMA